MKHLPATYMRPGRINGMVGFRVFVYDTGVKLGYSVHDRTIGKWVVCIYDGEASVETHREIGRTCTSRSRAYERILNHHRGRIQCPT